MTGGSPRRGLLLFSLLAVVTSASAGCGKGSYRSAAQTRPAGAVAASAHAATQRGASRPPRTRGGPRTVTQARAFAGAVNLTLADIPGASVMAHDRRPEASEVEARRCGGSVSDAGAVQVPSPDFVRGTALTREALSSRVTVLTSAHVAREGIAVLDTAAWRACYAGVLRHHFSGARGGTAGVSVDRVDLSTLPVRLPGVGESFGLRIAARLSSIRSHLAIRLYLDVFGFALGRSEINMEATSYVQPEPTRTEQELLLLMDRRAGLHPL